MGVVTRNHFEALTLLFQNEFWRQRFECRVGWRRNGGCTGVGQNGGNGQGVRPRCDDSAAYENSQLARNATEKRLLVVLHVSPSIQGMLIRENSIPRFAADRYIFAWHAAPMALATDEIHRQHNRRSQGMIRNDVQPMMLFTDCCSERNHIQAGDKLEAS